MHRNLCTQLHVLFCLLGMTKYKKEWVTKTTPGPAAAIIRVRFSFLANATKQTQWKGISPVFKEILLIKTPCSQIYIE